MIQNTTSSKWYHTESWDRFQRYFLDSSEIHVYKNNSGNFHSDLKLHYMDNLRVTLDEEVKDDVSISLSEK